jgi:hypothetical protein
MKNYEVIIGSPNEYEQLVAYIWIDNEQVAVVQKEEGIDKMKIEFFNEPIITQIYLNDFTKALEEAKIELSK